MSELRDTFAVFILTHGRAGRVVTLQTLARLGYTGRTYLLIDDEDDQEDDYRRLYGDKVVQFCKSEVARRIDPVDNFGDRRAILYARHAVFDVAEGLGLTHFQMLDDDVTSVDFRMLKEGGALGAARARPYGELCEAMCRFLDVSGALTVAFAQGGDLIGGANRSYRKGYMRKAMNSFFCRVGHPIDFKGTMNEDVCGYTLAGMRGQLMLSTMRVCIFMSQSQSVAGGMTEFYRETGTYVKTFYSVITSPACVKVAALADHKVEDAHPRVHHNVIWDKAYVKILREGVRKG